MKALINKALESKIWVVAGANVNPSKFGNRIYHRLKNAGYQTYPMNPSYQEVDGEKCYPNPQALPQIPDCVSMVVSPDIGKTLLQPMYDQGIRLLWFQPGSYNQELLDEAIAKNFEIIYDYCVLVELNTIGK